ncbi:amino acid permease [Dermatophilus congolensis]|nr:amino acid permease [Dermatophilus congolensis]MBO3129360.1 amino acid permease [Dermatophilus congolensis]MBO3132007.1 amino acid permease [Dermatophilus congolensis]MBO3133837.1 amino acid permease [Dermatophilus congolensis]MBO3136067.1 amino acid permease [Dermatophilus congolensis]MBO3138311.1 amino acid permease [Dermatophilus congolensis]
MTSSQPGEQRSSSTSSTPAQPAENASLHLEDAGDTGYHKSLTNRQVQMIALGGAIGVGLFLGAGRRLAIAGPSLILSYAFCGVIAFFLMRALGELVMHRRSSGSFVSYAREFFGDRAAYMAGWMYMLNWMTTGVAEITAIAVYISKWLPDTPQWISALVALALVLAINLSSAKAFGELEFWAALLKVLALSAFLIVGTVMVIIGFKFNGNPAGLHNLTSPDGFFPNGNTLAFVMLMQGVVFAYATIELVGTAAGETHDAEHVIPKAVRAVIYRIALFYVGSVFLLSCLLPYTAYKAGESPFVTAFGSMLPWIGDLMNVIVITAALSSCNSGLYSTGRILRSLAASGEAPRFTAKLNKTGVPAGGILLTAFVYFLGVILNVFMPGEAFDIAVETAAVGIVWTWVTIFACQMALRKRINKGLVEPTSFPMPGAPYTGWFGIICLVGIIVIMLIDTSNEFFNWKVLGAAALFTATVWFLWPLVKRNKERHPEFQKATELTFE